MVIVSLVGEPSRNAHGGLALQGQIVIDREVARAGGIARAEVARRSDHHRAGDAANAGQSAVRHNRWASVAVGSIEV
jgi:hypothetical protein